jgi:hypothetical protein
MSFRPHAHQSVSAQQVLALLRTKDQALADISAAIAADTTTEWPARGELRRRGPAVERFCWCGQPNDDSRTWIGCEHCGRWFHPECVALGLLTPEQVIALPPWLCSGCRSRRSEH